MKRARTFSLSDGEDKAVEDEAGGRKSGVLTADRQRGVCSSIAVHQYEPDVTLASSHSPINKGSEPDAAACDALSKAAAANKAKYDRAAPDQDARLMNELAGVTAEILADAEYPPQSFRLDSIRPLRLDKHVADPKASPLCFK